MADTVAAALREAAARLDPIGGSGRLDAELLMAAAIGVARSEMLLRRMADRVPPAFAGLVARRAAHEPIAHILGEAEFYGLVFRVTPEVLIPRGDSETLIDAARQSMAGRRVARVLDCGTGSGALLIAALTLWPEAEGIGVERSEGALAVAKANADRHAMAGRARMVLRDWDRPGWFDGLGRFDLVLANPPYVEEDAVLDRTVRDYEPAGALYAGSDGLDAYRALIPQLPSILASDGVALVEIGYRQAEEVADIAQHAGLNARLHRDLAGRPRALEMWIVSGQDPQKDLAGQ